MTMLDRMRRHKGWLKWSLALVCLAFVIFYIPDFVQQPDAGAAPGDVVAEVEGRSITAGEFDRIYRAQLQAYQGAYGANASLQLLKQLGLDRQILQQLIDEQAAIVEAERLGIRVTDAEVRARILALPIFQENGTFIGETRYRDLLRAQNPPMTPADFEDRVRRGTLVEKLRGAVTGWITVSDQELEAEYRRRNEKVKLEIASFPADTFMAGIVVSDAEIAEHFKQRQEDYRVPEKRKVRYVLVDVQSLRDKATVSAQEVERAYNNQIDQYSTPEQVRASHILLKTDTPGADEAALRKQAEDLLAQIRAGADFAALATKFSQDEASAKQGGDLGLFERGRMVPEFEQTAFSLEPGAVSDIVKTSYGFHIIKVTEKTPAATKTLDEVRTQIEDQLKFERAQAQAERLATEMNAEIDDPGDLDRVAQARGLKVQETGFFARTEPVAGLGFSPEASNVAFELQEGEVSDAIRTPQGYGFITVSGTAASYLPKLDEVRDRVKEAITKQKALDIARQRAAEVATAAKGGAAMAVAAKAAGIEVATTDLVARGASLPGIGVSAAVEGAAFSLTPGGVSDPIATDSTIAVVRVVERQDVDPTQLAATRESLHGELLALQRGRFFDAYMAKAKQRMRIDINTATLQRVTA